MHLSVTSGVEKEQVREIVRATVDSIDVNLDIKWVFRDFGEAVCETRTLLDRF
jgi:hypothetical protein